MPSLPILDVVIGVVFVYLLLALLCTTVNEMIAGLTKRRAQFLDQAIERLFNDSATKERFYETPFVRGLASKDPQRPPRQKLLDKALGRPPEPRPSYIPSDVFALAVRDMITGTTDSTMDLSAVQKGLISTGGPEFQRALTVMIDESKDVPALDRHLQRYFDEAMDRVSGWYKRNAQSWSLALAVLITLVVNADTLRITHTLWTNPTARAMAIEAAYARRDMDPPPDLLPMVVYTDGDEPEKGTPVEFSLTAREQELMASLTGWGPDWADYSRRVAELRAARSAGAVAAGADPPPVPRLTIRDHLRLFSDWLVTLLWRHGIGWLLTALAVSIGAPFWFDTLARFMNVRSTGPKPKKAEA
jgi:hypothetical protein